MSASVRGKSPANVGESARACLYAVVDRFNTDEPFWCAFVPVADLTEIGDDWFRVTLEGRGLRLTVHGKLVQGIGANAAIVPSLVVGAIRMADDGKPSSWHRVECAVDDDGKFVTSNFRAAIESAIADLG